MVCFGMMDNTIMILAGEVIEETIGSALGFGTVLSLSPLPPSSSPLSFCAHIATNLPSCT
jgi:hypothetical protein